MDKKPLMIPFDENGNLIEYVGHWKKEGENLFWKENYEFHATLYYSHFTISNCPIFYFTDVSGNIRYCMGVTQFERVVRNCNIIGREVEADWTFSKHGKAYYRCILTDKYAK